MLANMGACAPKLFAIANDVVDHEEKAIQLPKLHIQGFFLRSNCRKALVLVARNSGLLAFLEHLRVPNSA